MTGTGDVDTKMTMMTTEIVENEKKREKDGEKRRRIETSDGNQMMGEKNDEMKMTGKGDIKMRIGIEGEKIEMMMIERKGGIGMRMIERREGIGMMMIERKEGIEMMMIETRDVTRMMIGRKGDLGMVMIERKEDEMMIERRKGTEMKMMR